MTECSPGRQPRGPETLNLPSPEGAAGGFAPHALRNGYDIRTAQDLLGSQEREDHEGKAITIAIQVAHSEEERATELPAGECIPTRITFRNPHCAKRLYANSSVSTRATPVRCWTEELSLVGVIRQTAPRGAESDAGLIPLQEMALTKIRSRCSLETSIK